MLDAKVIAQQEYEDTLKDIIPKVLSKKLV